LPHPPGPLLPGEKGGTHTSPKFKPLPLGGEPALLSRGVGERRISKED